MGTHIVTTWRGVERVLRGYPARTPLTIAKRSFPHPRSAGMTSSLGLPLGQSADWRRVLPDGAGFHVRDFGTHYEAHIDEVHPDVSVVEHARRDAPGVFIATSATVGAAIGALAGGSNASTAAGAGVGAAVSALLTLFR